MLDAARRILGDAMLAEDAVQDATMRALKCNRPLPTREDARRWLVALTRNSSFDLIRGRRRLAVLDGDLDVLPAPICDFTERIGADEEKRRVLDTIGSLPATDREMMQMLADGHTQRELSEHLGVRFSTLRSRLSRVRSSLRRALNRQAG
ncbi:MAG: sigma-70 family RNA polymerase sigma factor [bacterium]|nr:sigma-70 family RNA polymerase sigma factor [bacterium]